MKDFREKVIILNFWVVKNVWNVLERLYLERTALR